MRTWERLRKIKDWVDEELCKGRAFKAPVPSMGTTYAPQINDFTMAEPRTFIAFQPLQPNEPGKAFPDDPFSVCPSITIMPAPSYARNLPEQRFDQYRKIHRPQSMGQTLTVQLLFSIYEPGIRMPGFAESLENGRADMSLLKDGTEAGVQTLVNWMDDAIELILRERNVPGTDLVLEDDDMLYYLFSDQSFIMDRRPLYNGIVQATFRGYANDGNEHGRATKAARLLDGIE